MKGMFKRALAGVAAAALAVTGLALGTGAANAATATCNDGYDCTITLQGDAGQFEGHTFSYVKIADYDVYGESPNQALTLVTNPTVTDTIQTAVGSPDGKDPLAWAMTQNPVKLDQSGQPNWLGDGTTRKLADQLAASATTTIAGTAVDGGLRFTFDAPGLYVIVDATTAISGDKYTAAIPMLVGTPLTLNKGTDSQKVFSEGVVMMKNVKPSKPGKTVGGDDHDTVAKNDSASYEVTATIPDYIGYKAETYKFVIHDQFGADAAGKVQYNDDFTVKVGENTLTSPDDYTVVKGQNGLSFSIDLGNYIRKTLKTDSGRFYDEALVGKTVTVTYTATILGATGAEGVTNGATVEYTNDPDSEQTGETPDTSTHVYNFDLTVNKTDKVTGEKLNGATFAIYPQNEDKTGFKETPVDTQITANGQLTFTGLDAGKYKVVETKPADGYMNMGVSFTVDIAPTFDKDGVLTDVTYAIDEDTWGLVDDNGTIDQSDKTHVTVGVENVENITQLPLTGAAGTMLFTVLGLLIAGAGVTVYMKSRNVKRALRG